MAGRISTPFPTLAEMWRRFVRGSPRSIPLVTLFRVRLGSALDSHSVAITHSELTGEKINPIEHAVLQVMTPLRKDEMKENG